MLLAVSVQCYGEVTSHLENICPFEGVCGTESKIQLATCVLSVVVIVVLVVALGKVDINSKTVRQVKMEEALIYCHYKLSSMCIEYRFIPKHSNMQIISLFISKKLNLRLLCT